MRSKIFKGLIIGLLLAFSSASYASDGPGSYAKTISDFIASHMNNDCKKFEEVMADDATLKIPRGETVLVQTRQKLFEHMKSIGKASQNCEAAYQVLAKSDAIVIARVDFNYENTIQHNFITLEKNEDKEWKITQVYKMFEDKDAPERPKVLAGAEAQNQESRARNQDEK